MVFGILSKTNYHRYSMTIAVPSEVIASAIVVEYWKAPVNKAVWVTMVCCVETPNVHMFQQAIKLLWWPYSSCHALFNSSSFWDVPSTSLECDGMERWADLSHLTSSRDHPTKTSCLISSRRRNSRSVSVIHCFPLIRRNLPFIFLLP
jgi:hypothetical protein